MLHHILWTNKIVNKLSANNCVYFRLWWICFAMHSTAQSFNRAYRFSLDFWCPLPPFVPFLTQWLSEWVNEVNVRAKHSFGRVLYPIATRNDSMKIQCTSNENENGKKDPQTNSKWNICESLSPSIFSTLSFLSYRTHAHMHTSHCKGDFSSLFFWINFYPGTAIMLILCALLYTNLKVISMYFLFLWACDSTNRKKIFSLSRFSFSRSLASTTYIHIHISNWIEQIKTVYEDSKR